MAVHTQKHTLFHYVFTVCYALVLSLTGSLVWLIVSTAGYIIFQSMKQPYHFLFGIPLILAGVGVTLNNLGTFLITIFSASYNKGMCKICN